MSTQLFPVEGLFVSTTQLSCTIFMSLPLPPLKPGEQPPPPPYAATMPLVVAKQLCMMLRQQLRKAEERLGTLVVPPESYQGMGVAQEDWENWFKLPPESGEPVS